MSREGKETEDLKGSCPFCLSIVEINLDVKGRPYWFCWRCQVRSFGTRAALTALKSNGWIWSKERPLDVLKAWLEKVAATGLEGSTE